MRTSKIKAKLARNEPALCTQLHLTDPSVFELASLMGFDGLWMDLEHHGYSVETAGQLMRAARVGTSDIVARPAKGEFMRMGRLLEMGAQAIMYPRCDDAREAAEVVRWSKFAPLGTRGFDGGSADALYTAAAMREYLEHANRESFILIQLEDQRAIEHAEEILATPGVDALLLGPADFSILGGFPLEFDHPQISKALEKIAAAARNTGKHWARTVGTPEQAGQALEMGARLLFHNADIVTIKRGLENIQAQFAPLGFRFENRLKPGSS
ncbi:MAG TPA: aldolase/citrate lyase family protein [Pirellulales bacterium]|nr:aldolase/citrate lyase family protein [Pirellulales bacterium]